MKVLDWKKMRFAFLFLIVSVFLFACQKIQETTTEITEKKEYVNYTEKQMLLLSLSKMEEIQVAFSEKIWDTKLDESGLTYKDEFMGEMQDFFIELQTLNKIAMERGVRLSTDEENRVGQVAGEFYQSIQDNPNLDLDISHEEVDAIYKEYALALKTKVEVTKDAVDSISEDDARILNLQQIVVATDEGLEKVKSALSEENADFFAIARQNSTISSINIEVGHEDMEPEIDRVVCELENGEVSEPILLDGVYYIYKCIDGYNIEATAKKKREMKVVAMDTAIQTIYSEYQDRNHLSMDSRVWDAVLAKIDAKYASIQTDEEHAFFFGLYKENFES